MNYGEVYSWMHDRKQKWFSGYSIKPCVPEIARLVQDCGATRLLDYGSGKGYQYLQLRVHEKWGGLLPHCYDPGVRQLSKRPEGLFDGIICTDVMEHIETVDVPRIFADIFSLAEPSAFVFFCIACRPAQHKCLPDGRNVHLTVKPPQWWDKQIDQHRRGGLLIEVAYDMG